MIPHSDDCSTNTPLPFRNHTSLLLATALPFLQPPYQHPVELIIKFLELSDTMKAYQNYHADNNNPLSALFRELIHPKSEAGLSGLINILFTDIEGLLCSLSRVCTGKEQDMVNLFLNLIRAKNIYETYGDLFQMGSFFPDQEAAPSSPVPDQAFSGDFSSMLNADQQDTLNLLKNLLSTE